MVFFQAAIGYNYEKNAAIILGKHSFSSSSHKEDSNSDSDSDASFDEIDLEVTLDVDKLDSEQRKRLTSMSLAYGMNKKAFIRYLTKDKAEQESVRLSKMLEDEKALYSGRKGRHKRREFHDEKVQLARKLNPRLELSYISKTDETAKDNSRERSRDSKRENSRFFDGPFTKILQDALIILMFLFRTSSESSSEEEKAPEYITSFDITNPADEEEPEHSAKKSCKDSHKKSKKSSRKKSTSREKSSRSRAHNRDRGHSSSRNRYSRRRSSRSRSRSVRRRFSDRRSPRDRRSRYSRNRSKSNSRSRYDRRRSPARYSGRYAQNRDRRRSTRSRSRSRSRGRQRNQSPKHPKSVSTHKSNNIRLSELLSKTRNQVRSRSSSDSSLEKLQRPQLDLSGIEKNSSENGGSLSLTNGAPNTVVKRYRRKSLSSNSSESDGESALKNESKFSKPPLPPIKRHDESVVAPKKDANMWKTPSKVSDEKKTPSDKKSAVEKMKKLMEKQLNQHIKQDKQSRALKEEKKYQEQLEWEEHQKSMAEMWAHKGRKKRKGDATGAGGRSRSSSSHKSSDDASDSGESNKRKGKLRSRERRSSSSDSD